MKKLALLLVTLMPLSLAYAQERTAIKPLINIVKSKNFGLPIDCTLGKTCHIMNYVDMGPNDGKQTDPACLARTYDGHKGTDFAIADDLAMRKGVNVLAALEGTIAKVRDGEQDQWPNNEQLETIKNARKECGNAVLITHENNIETIYCHLKKDSIRVKPGQKIQKGDIIAQVGMSGLTEFPHLHFGILKNKKIIDPFTGKQNTNSCGIKQQSLWDQKINIDYQPVTINHAGFSEKKPTLESISKNSSSLENIKPNPNLLTFWVTFLGVREGDKIKLEVRDPNDQIFAEYNITQEKTRARQFYFTGKKLSGKLLQDGAYTGTASVQRIDEKGEKITQNIVKVLIVSP